MATLEAIRAALFPDAVAVSDASEAQRTTDVAWVRVVRARVPALDVLEPADLVVVPAAALGVVAPTSHQRRDLVTTAAATRVAALLLVEAPDDGADPALAELGALARDAGLPAYRLAPTEPGTLERSLIGYLVDRRGELERQAAMLDARLARLALDGRGLDELVAAIAGFLRRPVALEGRRGDPLAAHAPSDVPDAAEGAAALAAYLRRPSSATDHVALPAAPGETGNAGRLVLLGERPVAEADRVVAERIAPLLALELTRDADVRRARDAALRSEPLPSEGPPWVVLLARQVVAGDRDAASREETRRELALRFPRRRLSLRGSSESLELRLVAAPEPDDPRGVVIADRVATFLGRPVAVSRPFVEPGDRPAAEASARAALEAAEALGTPDRIVRADRLAAYRLLGNLHNVPDGPGQARALLEPILGGRPATVAERLATLRAVVAHGATGDAAAALGIHRNTLAYRVRRIEAATGWDLADADLRLALAVALRLVQSAQA
ncbi:MAG TPA: helix-turn-helix domain-containing protein [Candidatus Limnocylindrales bacterium]|nr:helix-turn-helix domain-containing protein [Candidatus Limnocylindrales bacterium]